MTKSASENLKGLLEVVGVFAILLGLIFVGFELRQNTASVQAATSQGLLEQSNHSNFLLASDSDFAELLSTADVSLKKLSDVERLRYRGYVWAEFNIWEQAFYAHAGGTLNDRIWHGYDNGYRQFSCEPSPKVIWGEIKYFFGVEFNAHVTDGYLRECSDTGE